MPGDAASSRLTMLPPSDWLLRLEWQPLCWVWHPAARENTAFVFAVAAAGDFTMRPFAHCCAVSVHIVRLACRRSLTRGDMRFQAADSLECCMRCRQSNLMAAGSMAAMSCLHGSWA